jgi:hypothetical protein
MSELWANLLQRFQNASVKLGIKSALRPFIGFCLAITPLSFYLAAQAHDRVIALAFIGVGMIPVITTCIAGVRLAFKNPDTLRSETWQLREQVIQLMIQKGKPFPIDPATLESIANPEGPRLLQPGGTELAKEGER